MSEQEFSVAQVEQERLSQAFLAIILISLKTRQPKNPSES